MLVLKIIGIVLAVLLALLAIILLLSVDVILRVDEQKGARVLFRVLGFTFKENKKRKPQKEGKKKKEKKVKPTLSNSLKKVLGISHLDRESMEEEGFGSTLRETVELVKLLLDRVGWMLSHLKIPRCHITVVTGGEDAAMEYGLACATLYPLVGYLQERARVRKRGLRLEIGCDYSRKNFLFELDLAIRIRVYHVAAAAVQIVINNLKES